MQIKIDDGEIWADIRQIRAHAPLVHNITNFVVMNNTANALLAIGAAPVMAHAPEEVGAMVKIASALVVNIGTLSEHWVAAMKLALKAATAQRLPIVLDPVGAGATDYRTRTCHDLLALARPTIIRGNASEIMALVDTGMRTRGVDSVTDRDPAQAARTLARQFSCVVVVSGAVDLVTDGDASIRITNGHPLMPKVTGLGCTASALTGAFAAVRDQPLKAAAHAMAVMGICGEIAAQRAAGPGSLQTGFIDELYGLNEKKIGGYLKG